MSDWRAMLEESKSLFDDGLIDEEEYKKMREQALTLRDQGIGDQPAQSSSSTVESQRREEEPAHQSYQDSYSTQTIQPSSGIPMLVWIILGGGALMVVMMGLVILLWPATESHTELQDGYSMTCAAGWKFSDHSTPQYTDLRCEPDGMLSSGLFILQVYDDTSISVEEMHEIFLEGFIPAFEEMVTGFQIDQGQYATYGSFKGFQSTYSASLLGVQSDGMLITFQGCGKTFVVMNQTARDDAAQYAADFSVMESAIACHDAH